MLARLKRGQCLSVVEERRGGDVDRVEVVAAEEGRQIVVVLDAEPGGRRQRCRPVGRGHPDELNSTHLREVLEGEEAEPAAADHSQPDGFVVHETRPRRWWGEPRCTFPASGSLRARVGPPLLYEGRSVGDRIPKLSGVGRRLGGPRVSSVLSSY